MQGSHEGEANAPVASEDQARADFYALLARLYAEAPDAALLSAIAACDELSADAQSEDGRALAESWRKLIAAAASIAALAPINFRQDSASARPSSLCASAESSSQAAIAESSAASGASA